MSTAEPAGVRASSSEGAPDVGGDGPEVPQASIGWPRAIGSGLLALAIALGVTIVGTDWFLTNVTGLSRDNRVWLASALFLVVVGVAAWALRRLQARGLI